MTQANIVIEHLGAEYFSDPYSVHARLRAQHPVAQVIMPGGTPAWLVTGYAEARAALTDPRLRKLPKGWRPEPDSLFAALDLHMLNSDPPDHERLRKLVNKAFTARRVEQLRPRITAITAELLDDMSARQRGRPAGRVRVPAADHGDLRAARRAGGRPGPVPGLVGHHRRGHGLARGVPGRTPPRWSATSGTLLAARRREPADDLLSALISARDEEDRLSENELLSMAFLLLVAGHETTVNLIASGMLALLLNPGELARLRADPALLGGAVEELLRYVNPVNNATFRFTGEPVEIGGVHIGRGELVLVALSGANRDPSRYADPEAARPRPGQRRAPGVRPRHPLLPGRSAGPAGGRDRVPRAAGAVRLDHAGRARRTRCAGARARSSTAWSPCRCGCSR